MPTVVQPSSAPKLQLATTFPRLKVQANAIFRLVTKQRMANIMYRMAGRKMCARYRIVQMLATAASTLGHTDTMASDVLQQPVVQHRWDTT